MRADREHPTAEEICQAAAQALSDAVPVPARLDPAEWAALQDRLPRPGARPRVARWLLPGALGAAAGAVAVLLVLARPLSYRLEGAAVKDADGQIRTPAASSGALWFRDGTRVALQADTVARVEEISRRGARIRLLRGQASFDVVHREDAGWQVDAGVYQVLVTGTRFRVVWPAHEGRLSVHLEEGAVRVRHALGGDAVALKAGEIFTATPDGRATTTRAGEPPPARPPTPSAPAPVDVPPPTDGTSSEEQTAPEPGSGRDTHTTAPVTRRPRAPSSAPAQPSSAEQVVALPEGPRATEPPPVDLPPVPLGARTGSAPMPTDLGPSWSAPAYSPEASGASPRILLEAGGTGCLQQIPQLKFETGLDAVFPAQPSVFAFSNAELDHAHSWCGHGSLRVDLTYDLRGQRNRYGTFPYQTGEILFPLRVPIDLTDRTVYAHVFFDGPPNARLQVVLFAVNGDVWVNGRAYQNLTPGRWWTIATTFSRSNRLWVGGTSRVDRVGHIAVQATAMGDKEQRSWTGRLYIDDVGW